jgi:hypothetical protein
LDNLFSLEIKMSLIKIRTPYIIMIILTASLLVAAAISLTSVQARPADQESILADPEEIAPHGAFDLALGGGSLGWTYLVGEFCSPPGTVGAVDLATRLDDVLIEDCAASPANAVADDNFIYFADWGYDEIQRISITGGVTETLANASGLIYHRALAIDDEYLYFGDEAGIHRVLKSGGSVEDLSPNNDTSVMVADDTHLYWTEGAIGGGAIRRMPKAGGAEETLRSGNVLDNPGSIAVDETYVYWTELGSGKARRVAKDGSGDILDYVPEQPSYSASSIAVNDTYVFWTDTTGSADGRVRRVPKGGGTVEDIALGQFGPGGIQLSLTHIYWFNYYGIWRLPLEAEGLAVDLTITTLEITQGIQNTANEVTLVQDKSTFVRAFPAVDIANTADVSAVLHGFRNGVPLPGSPLTPMSPLVYVQTSGALRRNLNQSFNFWLPLSWRSGNVTLRAEINPNGTINESDVDNNSLSETRSFSPEAPVCMVMVPVRTHGSRYTVYSEGFWDIIDRFETLWPVPEARVYYQSSSVEELQVCWAGIFPYPCFGPYELPDDGWKVITSLIARDVFTDDPDECDSDNARTHYVGMVSPDTDTGNQTGYANFVFASSYVKMEHDPVTPAFSSPDAGATMAQELSHNYNGAFGDRWLHVDCGGPDGINPNYPYPTDQIAFVGDASHWGFDRLSLSLIEPDDARDYMSYCSPKWVSDYTWTGMMSEIGNLPLAGGATAVQTPSLELSPQAEVLFVNGVITPTEGTAIFDYSYRLDESMINPSKVYSLQQELVAPNAPAQEYALELVGPGGIVLLSQPFTPTPPFEDDPAQVFVLTVPYDPNTEIIRLVEDSTVLHQVEVSPNPPQVTVLQPNGGENITDQVTIQWEASDPDEDTLLYTIEYSPDDGATWQVVQTNYHTTTLTLTDTLGLPASDQARVRVIAWDGVNTAADMSDAPFSVANHPPVAHISTPEDGTSLKAGNQLILSGRGFDIEDGSLSGTYLEWLLDGTSVVGTGKEILLDSLAPGLHTITLRASDTQGAQDEVSIQVLVFTQSLFMPVIQR